MTTLTVPTPDLVFDPSSGPPSIEKPVTIHLAAPRMASGAAVPVVDVRRYGALVYRGPLGAEEVWDEAASRWTAAPADEAALLALTPIPVTAPDNPAGPWGGMLVAFGQQDATGRPRFAKAVGDAPVYRVRGVVQVARDGTTAGGVGTPSAEIRFTSAAERQRFRVTFDTEDAAEAGRARIFLQDSALRQAGYVEIRAVGGREVEVASCDAGGGVLARVTLTSDGDIHLVPAPGRSIVLDGPLEAQRVRYQPAGGGVRQTL